ncbi:TnsA endonuclease N-terminal domain-containing protein [Leclercia sp. AS011]|uniref:TnsA endonuclease N-terminal domain-containing protein n=1 Tax=Leclercia sp. AS011 TaxID=3081257 RepID=UPI0030170B0A
MSRGRSLLTIQDYQRALKKHYGLGNGAGYKPWLRVQDVPSKGTSSKIQGLKSNRAHHLLSQTESACFYQAEFLDRVVDIREQFPLLPLSLSMKIAETIGIQHPRIPTTKTPSIMTTDLLLTCQQGGQLWYEAISVKPEKQLSEERVAEKLDLERVWWELLGVPFKVFVVSEQTKIQSGNIEWATAPLRQGYIPYKGEVDLALALIPVGTVMVSKICQDFMTNIGMSADNALSLFRYLIATKKIIIDLDAPVVDSGVAWIIKINTDLVG